MRFGRLLLSAVLLCLAASAAAAALDRPETVSPGGLEAVEAAPALCPTFSWSGVARARRYEIAVFELAEPAGDSTPTGRRPALKATVPGGALSWTPAGDRCLAPATAYVWFVRALGRAGSAGDWSEGGMFRTPAPAVADLEQQIVRLLERYLAESRPRAFSVNPPVARPAAGAAAPAAGSEARSASRPAARAGASGETIGFVVDQAAIPGDIMIGVAGFSHSVENESAGVVGYSDAATGDVHGVYGISESSSGSGVLGVNGSISDGVGVLGIDEAASGVSAGVAGLTRNPVGYGGFFWNEDDTGTPLALVVGEPVGDPPTSINVEFSVDTAGNVFADGSVSTATLALVPLASSGTCTGPKEGQVYFDSDEHWLCICSQGVWKRASDGATCS